MATPFKNTFERCAQVAAQFASRKEFSRKAPREYDTARRQGWLDAISPLQPQPIPWTKERVAEVAKLYKNRTAMRSGPHQIALKRAMKNGWQDILPPVRETRPANSWTKETCKTNAQQYNCRSEWLKHEGTGAYKTAWRRGWLEECCAHMESSAPSDNDSVYLWRAAELTYNGLPVYKIGVTSTRLGAQRIQQVAGGARLTAKIIFNRWVPDARALEAQLLAFGQDPLYCDFDGASEFRALTDTELIAMQKLVDNQAIL